VSNFRFVTGVYVCLVADTLAMLAPRGAALKSPHRLLAIALTALAWATLVGPLRAQDYEVLHGFDAPPRTPGPVLQTSDGTLYGTFETGGAGNAGVLYSITPDGTFTILHQFEAGSGRGPSGRLAEGSDGSLYGTTWDGGAFGRGTLFRWHDGQLTIIHSFDGDTGDGPFGGVTRASDGALYGTTASGGPSGAGTLFKWDGQALTTLHAFGWTDGGSSLAPVAQGSDGAIYGTTEGGGVQAQGTLFKWDGTSLMTLHHFNGSDGGRPGGGLASGDDGALYGTTLLGGATGSGTLFKWDGTLTTLHTFQGSSYGDAPTGGVVKGFDGAIYGATHGSGNFGSGRIFRWSATSLTVVASFNDATGVPNEGMVRGIGGELYGVTGSGGQFHAGTLYRWDGGTAIEVLRSFANGAGNGPESPLTQGADGGWYGTTSLGGDYNRGTLFKWDGVAVTMLHSFNGLDGEAPVGRLTFGADGSLYGTTRAGGSFGRGTLFKWDGTALITLHSFGSSLAEGYQPLSGVIQGSDGSFYGTTSFGGVNNGVGTLFRWDGSGLTMLYSFEASSGAFPEAPLVETSDGIFYGVTTGGGAFGRGTLFRWDGASYTKLYDFDINTGTPRAGLLKSSGGRVYGTAASGGTNGKGTLFAWDDSGLHILHAFDGTTGAFPVAPVIELADGLLYGTTYGGGAHDEGTVFKWDGQAISVVHSFDLATGARPSASLTEGTDGQLYGTASTGSPGGGGTLFRLSFQAPSQPTTLTVNDVTGWVGSPITLQITLSASDGVGLSARPVEIDLDNDADAELVLKTDRDGRAAVTIPWETTSAAGYGAGTFSARVAFGGDADGQHGASEAFATIVLTKVPTIITVADRRTTYDGNPQSVSVTLFGADNTRLLPTITYGGSTQPPVDAGIYLVEASFAGSDIYEPATATATLTIDRAAAVLTWHGPDGFSRGSDMLEPRRGQAMALLDDRRVLLAGADNFTRGAELFDTVAGASTPTGMLQRGRCYGCSTVRLFDGRIFIAGGWTGGPVESTGEVYTPAAGTFTLSANGMQSGRIGAMASVLPDGRVLVAGGHNGSQILASADIFDPTSNQFTPAPALSVPRLGVGVPLRDGRLLFIGGLTSGGSYLATAEIYDPQRVPAAQATGAMSEGRHGHAAVRLFDGRVLVTGGFSNATRKATPTAEIYVPENGTFSRVGDMSAARSGHVLVVLPSGKVLVAGGTNANGAVLSTAEVFDPATGVFTPASDLQGPRTGAGAVLLPDRRVLIAGGTGANGEILQTTEFFGPTQELPSIPYGTRLGPAQLTATASTAGQFTYTPPEGTILGVGTHTLLVQFTPDDADNYESATASVTIQVRRALTSLSVSGAETAGGGDLLISATLYDEFGVGVSGRRVDFDLTSDGTYDASAFSNASGVATASVSWAVAVASGVQLGMNPMTVRFQGDTEYLAAANASASLQITDHTPPVIVATTEGTQSANGWFTSDVVVSWSIVDAESGVTATEGCGPTTISEDSNGVTLTCSASSAGGSATVSTTIKRDTTPPLVRSPLEGITLERHAEATLEWSCDDLGSGVSKCTVDSGLPLGSPVDTAQTGPFDFTITATDAAGQTNVRTIRYVVVPATNAFVWAAQPDTDPAPSPRYGHGIVYDSIRKKVILIGGLGLDGSHLNDVWERDSETGRWESIVPATETAPIPRHNFGIAYDPTRQVVIVFSGRVSGDFSNVGLVGDTWEWNPSTRTWRRIPGADSPWFAGLREPSLAWDPVGEQVILFGGEAYWGETNYVTYALRNGSWTQLTAEGPEGRARAAMATDSRRQRVVLHSGWNRNPQGNWWMLTDTWEWDGVRWQQMHAGGSAAPPPRVSAAMAYDEARAVTVLFGGSPDGIFLRFFASDTWEWNGRSWNQRQTSGSPSPRVTSMAYDQMKRELVLFGGNGTSGLPAEAGLGDFFLGQGYETLPVQLSTFPVDTTYGQGAAFRATLTGPAGPLAARVVHFDVDADGDVDGTATTDEGGNAVLLLSAEEARMVLRVGTYSWTAEHRAEDVYGGAAAPGSVTVARATPTVTLTVPSIIYDGLTHSANVAVVGAFGEDFSSQATLKYAFGGVPVDAPQNAGVYTVTATFAGNEWYTSVTSTRDLTIARAPTQVEVVGGSFTYDGESHGAIVRVVGAHGEDLGPVPLAYMGPIEEDPAELPAKMTEPPVDAGLYRADASFPGTANYLPSSGTAKILIAPADPAITLEGAEHVYDGQPHPTLAFATGVAGEDLGEVNVNYEPGDTAPVDAGTYTASATFKATRNYKSLTRAVQIVIHRASPMVSLSGGTFTYDRKPHPATAAAFGVQGEELPVVVQYSSGDAPINAGMYQATAVFAGTANYSPASKSVSIEIVRAVPTVSVSGGTFGYDGQAHPATASVTGVGGEGLGEATISYEPGGSVPVDAGEYLATAAFSGTQNYEAATGTAVVTIARGAPTVQVSGGSFAYDSQPHAASGTARGVNGEDLGPLTFTYNGSADVPVHAGTYTVVGNFAGAGNYQAATATTIIEISRAPLSISVQSATKVYGQPNPAFAVAYAGFAGDEGPQHLAGTLSFTTNAGDAAAVGTYAVTAVGVSSGDYAIAFADGILTVVQAESVVEFSSSSNPAGYSQSVALRADVAPVPIGAGVATGTVDFVLADGTVLGSSTLISGTAVINVIMASGSHDVTARFNGDANVRAGSATLVQVVNDRQGSSTTDLIVRPSSSSVGEAVRLEARVTATGTPTGTVEFLDGETVIGTGALTSGRAIFETASLTAGAHVLTARYPGEGVVPGSTSSPVMLNVYDGTSTKERTTVRISTRNARAGDPVVIEVRVASANTVPTGAVSILVDGQLRGTVALTTDGTAMLTVEPLLAGEHVVTALYEGSTTHSASSGEVILRVR
jgi:uncharacterized repeat protein (TIGR03803 family)